MNMSNGSSKLLIDKAPSAFLNENAIIKCEGEGNRLILLQNAKLGKLGTPKLEFLGNNNTLIIGEWCNVKRGHYRLTGNNNVIDIGTKTTINGAYMLCDAGSCIKVGSDCLLSYSLEFRTTDAHSIFDKNTGDLLDRPSDINVGNHVWIGKEACILQGVKLADNIIVGMRALVTKCFLDEFTAIAGAPAKIVNSGVTWDRQPPKKD
jgi:acetyltransferase-like isoleucine patch superfamily enzyme